MRPVAAALASVLLLAASLPAPAADPPRPEVARAPAPPQAVGHAHTLRTIPEACTRLQGEFTGDPAQPYRFQAVHTSVACQPRARVLAAGEAGAPGPGWVLNDRIRVPSASCQGLEAVVEVWREARGSEAPALDAQGKSRIYLEEGLQRAKSGKLAALPAYAVGMQLVGEPCR